MNESITIEKQDENNVIDELNFKNCALKEQADDLKNQLQSLQKRNETPEYTPFFYKNTLYKNIEAQIVPKNKNKLRTS